MNSEIRCLHGHVCVHMWCVSVCVCDVSYHYLLLTCYSSSLPFYFLKSRIKRGQEFRLKFLLHDFLSRQCEVLIKMGAVAVRFPFELVLVLFLLKSMATLCRGSNGCRVVDAVTRLRSGCCGLSILFIPRASASWCGCPLRILAVMDREWRLDSRINGIVMKCCQTLHFVMSSVTSGVRNGEWILCWRLFLFLSDLTRRTGNTNILSKHCSSSI